LVKARTMVMMSRLLSYLIEGLVIYVVLCVIPNYKDKINTR